MTSMPHLELVKRSPRYQYRWSLGLERGAGAELGVSGGASDVDTEIYSCVDCGRRDTLEYTTRENLDNRGDCGDGSMWEGYLGK
jgi:hypothetical protein